MEKYIDELYEVLIENKSQRGNTLVKRRRHVLPKHQDILCHPFDMTNPMRFHFSGCSFEFILCGYLFYALSTTMLPRQDRVIQPHVLDRWCCWITRKCLWVTCEFSNIHLFHQPFDNLQRGYFGPGNRIGEADNPGPSHLGPEQLFSLALINPTSIFTRSQDVADLDVDITCMPETSATSTVQHHFRTSMKAKGQDCVFTSPVESQKPRLDGTVSDRGLASGVAITGKLPMRKYRCQDMISPQHHTRILPALIQFGASTILVVVVYGYQQNLPEAKKKTNFLINEACQIVLDHKGPSIILGDFNHDLETLDSATQLAEAGFINSIDLYHMLNGENMPPTYQESSRRDMAIFSTELAASVTGIQILPHSPFPGHKPILFQMSLPEGGLTKQIWKVPRDWTELNVNPALLESNYDDLAPYLPTGHPMKDLQNWSHKVELAVHMSLISQHQMTPDSQPYSGLPKNFAGRCKSHPIKSSHFRAFGPTARQGDFNPDGEIRSVVATQLLRQVRRLESYSRRLKKLHTYNIVWKSTQESLSQEWKAICKAKGFEVSFPEWVCTTMNWPIFPLLHPTLREVEVLEQLVKQVFREKYESDLKIHKAKQNYAKYLDQVHGYDRNSYQRIREPPKQFIKGMNRHRTVPCELQRMISDDLFEVSIPENHGLITCEKMAYNSFKGEIADITETSVLLHFFDPPGDLPNRFKISMCNFGMQPDHVHQALSDFWMPIWNRDVASPPPDAETFDNEVASMQLPKFGEQHEFGDINIWMQTISKLKSSSSPGSDGWYNSELKALPQKAVSELVAIFLQPEFCGFEQDHMRARVVSLPKKEQVTEASETRPITVLPTLYRLWTAVHTRVIMSQAPFNLPVELTGLVKRRGGIDSMYDLAWLIEKSHSSQIPLGGLTLDLTKAFNQFPRCYTKIVLKHMGVPSSFLDQWMYSIGNVVRHFDHRGWISEGKLSTTGVPEGDAASILAMLSIATLWIMKLKPSGASIKAYADNLSWSAHDRVTHQFCLEATIRTFNFLKIPIDWNKTWAWYTKNSHKKLWEQLGIELLGHPIQVVSAAQDLGVVLSYSPFKRLLTTLERLQAAKDRLKKLFKLNLAVPVVSKIIQSAIWTKAFYGVSISALSSAHIGSIRLAAAQAITHTKQPGIASLAVHLCHRSLTDPEAFVILQAVRDARKFLHRHPNQTLQF